MTSMNSKDINKLLIATPIMDELPIPINLFNSDGELIYVNSTYFKWLDDCYGDSLELPDVKEQINRLLSDELHVILEEILLCDSSSFVKEVLVRTSNNCHESLRVTFRKLYLNNEFSVVSCVFENEAQNEKNYALYKRQAHIDPLTGVYNRFGFYEAFNVIKQKTASNCFHYCVFIADIDGLKIINDTKGHLIGDEVIKFTANSLSKCLRDNDILCRWGGDEFIVIIMSELSNHHLKKLKDQVLDRIHNTISSLDHAIALSIGTAMYQDDGNELDELINYADKSMYEVKRRKSNSN